MKRLSIIVGGLAVGIAAMLGVLQPWKRGTPAPIGNPDRVTEARRHLDAGRLDEARTLLQAEPESALTHALQAHALIRSGDTKAAQERLARAAALDPDLFEIPLYQGHLDMLAGDRRAATRSYTEAIRRKPGDARALAGRAAARAELKEYAGAIEDATGALAGDPSDPDALFTRAAAYGSSGRWEESIRDWTSYLARRPRDAHGWTNRGNALDRLGRKAAAAADWRQAVLLEPSLGEHLNPLIKEAGR